VKAAARNNEDNPQNGVRAIKLSCLREVNWHAALHAEAINWGGKEKVGEERKPV
jgi:hypothetical protein